MKKSSNTISFKSSVYAVTGLLIISVLMNCKPKTPTSIEVSPEIVSTVPFENGVPVTITVNRGKEYKYPLLAIWVEDSNGNFLGNLYVSQSIATGIFRYGEYKDGKWLPGERNRPAALPRWSHLSRRSALPPQPVDAVSGATPQGSFVLNTTIPVRIEPLRVMMEVNRPWDFNPYWHNNRFPGDEEYKTSGQPALIYVAEIAPDVKQGRIDFKPIGHSHSSGADEKIYDDITTFSGALKIIESAWIEFKER